jgi:hypothetical protein
MPRKAIQPGNPDKTITKFIQGYTYCRPKMIFTSVCSPTNSKSL